MFHSMKYPQLRWLSCFWRNWGMWGPYSFWRAWLWHTSASLCKNENGICTQAELQAVAEFLFIAKTRMGKDVVQGIE